MFVRSCTPCYITHTCYVFKRKVYTAHLEEVLETVEGGAGGEKGGGGGGRGRGRGREREREGERGREREREGERGKRGGVKGRGRRGKEYLLPWCIQRQLRQ